jgi:hypothetical protein
MRRGDPHRLRTQADMKIGAFVTGTKARVFNVLLVIVALILIRVGWSIWQHPKQNSDFHMDNLLSGMIGALLGAILTLLLAYVAWKQLNQVARTQSASFVLEVKSEFFQERTRALFTLIGEGLLKFVQPDAPKSSYFEIDIERLAQLGLPQPLRSMMEKKQFYSTYEVDDLLLGHFEDLGLLTRLGIVELDIIYGMFSWYIEETWENEAIKSYIESERSTPEDIETEEADIIDADMYEDFEYIYTACKNYR